MKNITLTFDQLVDLYVLLDNVRVQHKQEKKRCDDRVVNSRTSPNRSEKLIELEKQINTLTSILT